MSNICPNCRKNFHRMRRDFLVHLATSPTCLCEARFRKEYRDIAERAAELRDNPPKPKRPGPGRPPSDTRKIKKALPLSRKHRWVPSGTSPTGVVCTLCGLKGEKVDGCIRCDGRAWRKIKDCVDKNDLLSIL